ncbi:hypothetical protein LCGC14_2031460, partial [marine sediment metagenome]
MPNVPNWAIELISDVAATKADVASIKADVAAIKTKAHNKKDGFDCLGLNKRWLSLGIGIGVG